MDATYRITKIVLKAGHEKICIITGSNRIGISRERLSGYHKAYEECGLAAAPTYIFEGDFTAKTAYAYSKKMLAAADRPSAVITCNNSLGLGFLQALTERRMEVPRDIEHIGIDEIDSFDYLHMRYNHVIRKRGEMAYQAIDLLMEQMEHGDKKGSDRVITPELEVDHHLMEIAIKEKIISK